MKFTEKQILAAIKSYERGKSVTEICEKLGVHKNTFYGWRKKYLSKELKNESIKIINPAESIKIIDGTTEGIKEIVSEIKIVNEENKLNRKQNTKLIFPIFLISICIIIIVLIDIYVIKEHHGYPITSFIIIPAFILIFLFITIILPLIIAFINFQELIVEIKNKNITPLEIINAIIFNCLLLVISYYAINYSINFEIQDLPYPLFDDENEILVYII